MSFCRRGAFIPFITAGDPDIETTEQALLALDRAGADIIELGVPYSVRTQKALVSLVESRK